MTDTDDAPTTADTEQGIRTELATIRRHWPHTFNPPTSQGAGSRDTPASRFPGNDAAISLRAEVTRDLAFWVHAYIDNHPDGLGDWVTIDAADVPRTCRYLTDQAPHLARWQHGNRLWSELTTLAREVRMLANPPRRDSMPIGECPECTTVVRAKAHDPGNIKCRGCGTTDTIDGWIIRIVGNEPLVTADQLVPILHKRLGINPTRATIRQWVARGVIPQDGLDAHGRAMFDRKAVFHALIRNQERRNERIEA
jgi:hypothetical protein